MTAIHSMIEKLGRLLRSRFGVVLAYEGLNSKHLGIKDKLLRRPPLRMENEWLFPVFSGYQLVGCAKVSGAEKALDEISPQLAEFVGLYLDAAFHLQDRLEILNLTEGQIRFGEYRSGGDNVIPFHRNFKPPEPLSPPVTRRLRAGFALPCLIEGPTYHDLKKLAFELHEISGRYAFVYLDDITWNSVKDLKSLGPVTLLIPELNALSPEDQRILLDYLRRRPGMEDAQIVACSLFPFSQLQGRVRQELLQILSSCYFKMDRPFQDFRRENLTKFFFDNLIRDQKKGRLI